MQNNSNRFLDESLAVSWGRTAYNAVSTGVNAVGSLVTVPATLLQKGGDWAMRKCAEMVDDPSIGGWAAPTALVGVVCGLASGAGFLVRKAAEVTTKATAMTVGGVAGTAAGCAGAVVDAVRFGLPVPGFRDATYGLVSGSKNAEKLTEISRDWAYVGDLSEWGFAKKENGFETNNADAKQTADSGVISSIEQRHDAMMREAGLPSPSGDVKGSGGVDKGPFV